MDVQLVRLGRRQFVFFQERIMFDTLFFVERFDELSRELHVVLESRSGEGRDDFDEALAGFGLRDAEVQLRHGLLHLPERLVAGLLGLEEHPAEADEVLGLERLGETQAGEAW